MCENNFLSYLTNRNGTNSAHSGTVYADYLQLGKILSAQAMRSTEANNTVHDEHLFIVIHQGKKFKYFSSENFTNNFLKADWKMPKKNSQKLRKVSKITRQKLVFH